MPAEIRELDSVNQLLSIILARGARASSSDSSAGPQVRQLTLEEAAALAEEERKRKEKEKEEKRQARERAEDQAFDRRERARNRGAS